MRTVTKKELTDRIADEIGAKRTVVKDIIQQFLDDIAQELAQGNRCEFRDFGVFEIRTRKPRMAQNPRTLERVPVPLKTTVKFKVGRLLKERVQRNTPGSAAAKSVEPKAEPASASPASPPPGT